MPLELSTKETVSQEIYIIQSVIQIWGQQIIFNIHSCCGNGGEMSTIHITKCHF